MTVVNREGAAVDAGLEVTDARKLLRVLALGGAAVLILLLGLGSLVVLPMLSRADRALDAIEDALPVVEEQIGPDVATLRHEVPPTVDEMLAVLDNVQSQLGDVNDGVTALHPPLRSMDTQVGGLRQDVEPISLLGGVLDAVRVLPEVRDAVGVLPEMLASLEGTRTGVADVNSNIVALRERLDDMIALLEEIEQHVENIDRKTGPVVPPDPT